MHRRQEVLRYLANAHSHTTASPTSDPNLGEHYKMSEGLGDYVNLTSFVAASRGAAPDPAKKVCSDSSSRSHPNTQTASPKDFVKRLKNYIARWTLLPDPDITSYEHFTEEHRRHIKIISDTLYRHKTLELTYTTYDMQDGKDKIYQRRYPDVMVLSDDEEHPYLYGRILDFFHVTVMNNGPNSLLPKDEHATLHMAWVRWYKHDTSLGPSGFTSLRYPTVSFYKGNEPDAFGFIHPDEIIRAAHLIPSFKSGSTVEYLAGPSKGRPEGEVSDWKYFNVNM